MNLTDWVVILAIVLAAIAFLCPRNRRRGSFVDRARRAQGRRLLMQAAVALWGALLTLERCFVATSVTAAAGRASPSFFLRPHVALGMALALAVVGLVWAFRACRLFKARRIFSTC
ncbi:hypothetical protein [Paraburkholderia acidisoli]|uniref:Uncharacterized protein n=1 Tax=Paraburkholderia acidisoli TaxID=2571748 RepID=A0A7Z2GHT4_9BURK|nr:hypothetical protein [Paraburkholderia acidisoli]QGZ61739.1 hypothetical protein FAZ98_08335 [Paraburkholderia acidisoli]